MTEGIKSKDEWNDYFYKLFLEYLIDKVYKQMVNDGRLNDEPKPLSNRCYFYISEGKCKDDSNCENCMVNVNSKTNVDKRKKLFDDMINN